MTNNKKVNLDEMFKLSLNSIVDNSVKSLTVYHDLRKELIKRGDKDKLEDLDAMHAVLVNYR